MRQLPGRLANPLGGRRKDRMLVFWVKGAGHPHCDKPHYRQGESSPQTRTGWFSSSPPPIKPQAAISRQNTTHPGDKRRNLAPGGSERAH